jgi:hypothetical protein
MIVKCGLSAGEPHDTDPPDAAVEVILEWAAHDGSIRHRTKNLCTACYDDKMREFTDTATEGRYSLITVTRRYQETP